MPRTARPTAAEQFTALGVPADAWTDAMRIAVKQDWRTLPLDRKVSDLRDALAAVEPDPVPSLADLAARLGDPDAANAERARLRRNAGVNAWRARTRIQAALDARGAKFAAMRAKATTATPKRPGTDTGDTAARGAAS